MFEGENMLIMCDHAAESMQRIIQSSQRKIQWRPMRRMKDTGLRVDKERHFTGDWCNYLHQPESLLKWGSDGFPLITWKQLSLVVFHVCLQRLPDSVWITWWITNTTIVPCVWQKATQKMEKKCRNIFFFFLNQIVSRLNRHKSNKALAELTFLVLLWS